MDWSPLARWEWLLIELLVLGWAIRELISVRRERRKASEAAETKNPDERPVEHEPRADDRRDDAST